MKKLTNHRLTKVETVYEATGCSHWGKLTKRDGHFVSCGHKHRTREQAQTCADAMKHTRPGKCQRYRVTEMLIETWKKV